MRYSVGSRRFLAGHYSAGWRVSLMLVACVPRGVDLRDVFAWAYERSCQRYTLLKQALPEPDPLRLRYRDALIHIVGEVVRGGSATTPAIIRQLAATSVPADDMAAFVTMAINELANLHEGNIARYRLRLSEFHDWQMQHHP